MVTQGIEGWTLSLGRSSFLILLFLRVGQLQPLRYLEQDADVVP